MLMLVIPLCMFAIWDKQVGGLCDVGWGLCDLGDFGWDCDDLT